MGRKVFYSFHYSIDGWRASQVRNMGAVEGNEPATDNSWEEVKRGGDPAIKRWIDNQLNGRTCTIVLIGEDTANRSWIKYEIEKSWNDGKGLLGIRIHRLLNAGQQAGRAGPNPFTQFTLKNGQSLTNHVTLYDPPYAASKDVYNNIRENLSRWIEDAINRRG